MEKFCHWRSPAFGAVIKAVIIIGLGFMEEKC